MDQVCESATPLRIDAVALLECPPGQSPLLHRLEGGRCIQALPLRATRLAHGRWRLYGACDPREREWRAAGIVDVRPGQVVACGDRLFAVVSMSPGAYGGQACWVDDVIAQAPASKRSLFQACLAAHGHAPVLITGESGCGKELFAALIHRHSDRARGPLVPVNCAAITESLADSEMFGHTRGAFTGAAAEKEGLVSAAHGGTLFLDEVGELPLSLQAKLLRTLESGEVRPVGATRPRLVDVRFVAATHRPLHDWASREQFRADLLFRLGVLQVQLPPLRERPDDIPVLMEAILRRTGRALHFDAQAQTLFLAHPWPGNVRELRNAIDRLLVAAPFGRVDQRAAAAALQAGGLASEPKRQSPAPKFPFRQHMEAAYQDALDRHRGNRKAAYESLGVSKSTFYRWLREQPAQVRALGD